MGDFGFDKDAPIIPTTSSDVVAYAARYRDVLKAIWEGAVGQKASSFKDVRGGIPDVQGERFENYDLSEGKYHDCGFSGARFSNVNFTGATLTLSYWQNTALDSRCRFDYANMGLSAFSHPEQFLDVSIKGTIFFMCPDIDNRPGLAEKLKAKGAIVDGESLLANLRDSKQFSSKPWQARHIVNVAVNILSGAAGFPILEAEKLQLRSAISSLIETYPNLSNIIDPRAKDVLVGRAM